VLERLAAGVFMAQGSLCHAKGVQIARAILLHVNISLLDLVYADYILRPSGRWCETEARLLTLSLAKL